MVDDFGAGRESLEPTPPKRRSAWPLVPGIILALVCFLVVVLFAWQSGWFSDISSFFGTGTSEEMVVNPLGTSGETISENYEWTYEGIRCKLNLTIDKALYDYYRSIERAPVEDYSIYVTHPADDNLTNSIASELKRQAKQKGYDEEETINFAAGFVQNIEYKKEEKEYPRYPVETLVDRGGDCEDTAILMAALLQDMGYDAVLLRFSPENVSESGHMAVGVVVSGRVSGGYKYPFEGKTYYYLETTDTWPVGTIPKNILSEFQGSADAIYKLAPTAALKFTDFSWIENNRWLGSRTVDLEVTVTNWGTADANDFYVRAYFDGYESGAKLSAAYDLKYGYKLSGVAIKGIAVPSGGVTLHVELFHGGELVNNYSLTIN